LIPWVGIEGCAWATVLAYLSCTAVFAVLLNKKVRIPISWVFVAFIPNLTSAIIFSYSGNVFAALITGIILTLLFVYTQLGSVSESLHILRRIVKS
jgi:Na+-driven multidrug efflux pump